MIGTKVIAIIVLLASIINIVQGGLILWGDFKPDKRSVAIAYIAIGIFLLAYFIDNI